MHLSTLRLLLALSLLLLAGCDGGPVDAPAAPETPGNSTSGTTTADPSVQPVPVVSQQSTDAGDAKELKWDELIPPDWNPEKLLGGYDASELSDDDPRAIELMDKLKRLWDEAPVVESLDGRRVKLPGFVVPLEMDAKSIGEFLLVPYYGACIHVPPPPTNQTVHVVTPDGKPYQGALFDTVWVTGVLKVEKYKNELGNAGYSIHAGKVEPYE